MPTVVFSVSACGCVNFTTQLNCIFPECLPLTIHGFVLHPSHKVSKVLLFCNSSKDSAGIDGLRDSLALTVWNLVYNSSSYWPLH
jgi:hypothetical protein